MPDQQISLDIINKNIFGYSIEWELGMRDLLGYRVARQAAVAAQTPSGARKVLKQSITKLSKRVDEITTMDERLRSMLLRDFDMLGVHVANLGRVRNQMEILGRLICIISRLLGYDWADGKVHRTPIYFRTKGQEFRDYQRRYHPGWQGQDEEDNNLVFERRRICLRLNGQGMPINQIARVLNMSDYAVRQLIRDETLTQAAEMLESGHSLEDIMEQLRQQDSRGWGKLFGSLGRERGAARDRTSSSEI